MGLESAGSIHVRFGRRGEGPTYGEHELFRSIGGSGLEDDGEQFGTWLAGSDIDRAMEEVRNAEAAVAAAKRELSQARKKVARAMMD